MDTLERKATGEKVQVRRTRPVRGVRWRSAEERREAKRKIDAIRRAAEAQRLQGTRLDMRVLRSPKAMLLILGVLVVIGLAITTALNKETIQTKRSVRETVQMQERARKSVRTAAMAMTYFRVHTLQWPTDHQGLRVLTFNNTLPRIYNWKGPYINYAPTDPWGTPYVYRAPDSRYEAPTLFSCGPDTLPDTDDDIRAVPEDFRCDEGTWRQSPEDADDLEQDLEGQVNA